MRSKEPKNYLFRYRRKTDSASGEWHAIVLATTKKEAWLHAIRLGVPEDILAKTNSFNLTVDLLQEGIGHSATK